MAYPHPPQDPHDYGPPPTGTPYQPSAGNPYPPPAGAPYPPQGYMALPNQPAGLVAPAPKKKRRWPWIILAVLLVLLVISIAGGGTESTRTSAPGAAPTAPATEDTDPVRLDPVSYESLTERDYALILKDPEASAGRKIVVYGEVIQFDTATGPSRFMASTSAVPIDLDDEYFFGDRAVVDLADRQLGADVAQDDIVKMYVEVKGTFEYENLLGGEMVVPRLRANIVELVGQ